MSRHDRRTLARRLEVLLLHLLKWRFQPARRGRSWQRTIQEQRRQVMALLIERPGLRSEGARLLQAVYPRACQRALREMRRPEVTVPETCPWTMPRVLDDAFWPETDGDGA
jgi:hypothetical protein